MTKESLQRGNEIQCEIRELERALVDIRDMRLFRGYDPGYTASGCAFLTSLEVSAKQSIAMQIEVRINALKAEFTNLT